jgi:hypothetical protein
MPPPTMITSNAIRWIGKINKPQRYEFLRRNYQLIIKYLLKFQPRLAVFFVALCSLFFSFAKPQRIGEAEGLSTKH